MSLVEDLEYLRTNAFEFSLAFNPSAGGFQDRDEYIDGHGDLPKPDWVSLEQQEEARRTGLIVEGCVYSVGSVSYDLFAGTKIDDVVKACADACREERERWRRNAMELPVLGLRRMDEEAQALS